MKFVLIFVLTSCLRFPGAEFKLRRTAALNGRIFNGKRAKIYQFPFQVGIRFYETDNNAFWCSGVLIDPKWILTAAHCVADAKNMVVFLGSIVRGEAEISFHVPKHRLVVHGKFDKVDDKNDIALINIPKVRLSKTVQVVGLPAMASSYPTYETRTVLIAGWGKERDKDADYSKKLNWGRMKIISNTECREVYGPIIVSSHLCASSQKLVATCEGDSGGPAILESDGTLIGISSFGHDTSCESGYPVAFTRVTSYLKWIKTQTGI